MKIFYFSFVLLFIIFSNLKGDIRNIERLWENYHHQVEGWCSSEKAFAMIDIILRSKPKVCVEIGVFGGASILPTALALRENNNGGMVYAIDPWDTNECVKGMDRANYDWWYRVDLTRIYHSYLSMLKNFQINNFVKTLKMNSEQALNYIPDGIDILHIDGNHSYEAVEFDVLNYYPKVKKGGYIWCDDYLWNVKGRSPSEAYNLMLDECEIVEFVDGGNCVLLQKR